VGLSQITQKLISVQNDVDKTEKAILGKVFDIQAIRNFMTHHAELNAANQVAKNDVGALEIKSDELNKRLAGMKLQQQVRQGLMRAESAQLEAMVAQQGATIHALQQEIAARKTIRAKQALMKQVHDQLTMEKAQQVLKGEMMKQQIEVAINKGEELKDLAQDAELSKVKMAMEIELKKHQSLRMQLVTLHNYGDACHTRVEQLGKQTHIQAVEGPKEDLLLKAVEKHAIAAENAATQRLQAEKMILSAELEQAKMNVKMAHSALTAKTKQFERLKGEITATFTATRSEMKANMDRIKTLNKAIHANIQKEKEDRKKLAMVEMTVQDLMKELDPTRMATLNADNYALKSAFTRTEQALKKSKMEEAQALAEAGETAAEVKALEEAAKISKQEKLKAAKEGAEELKKATLEATKNQEQADKTKNAAQAALEKKCRPEWDTISSKKNKELQTCKALESELAVAKAQQETLMQTLKAEVATD